MDGIDDFREAGGLVPGAPSGIAPSPACGILPALAALAAASTDALLEISTEFLDALDRTGSGVGVCPGYRARLSEDLSHVLTCLSCRMEGDGSRLKRRERLVERARSRVDDHTFVVIEMAVRRDRAALGRRSATTASPDAAAEPSEGRAVLEAALASYASKRRTAMGSPPGA